MSKVVTYKETNSSKDIECYKGGIRKLPAETKIVAQVADWICEGKTDEWIILNINDIATRKIDKPMARKYISAALDYLFPDGVAAQRDEILAKNAKDLMQIVSIGMHDHKYLKEANAAIRELNRMIGVGNGTTIAIANDAENNTQQVIIKFDGQ